MVFALLSLSFHYRRHHNEDFLELYIKSLNFRHRDFFPLLHSTLTTVFKKKYLSWKNKLQFELRTIPLSSKRNSVKKEKPDHNQDICNAYYSLHCYWNCPLVH